MIYRVSAVNSGMDSVEYRIFRDEYASLHEGIQAELDKIVPKAYSAGLIGSATEDAATLITWTSDQKANSLLKAIDSRIKTESRAFYDFLEVLMSLPTLQFFADRLNGRLPPELQLKIWLAQGQARVTIFVNHMMTHQI